MNVEGLKDITWNSMSGLLCETWRSVVCLSMVRAPDTIIHKLSDCQVIITCCWIHHFPPAPQGISAALSLGTHAAVIRNACKKVVEMLDSWRGRVECPICVSLSVCTVTVFFNIWYSNSAQMLRPEELFSSIFVIHPMFDWASVKLYSTGRIGCNDHILKQQPSSTNGLMEILNILITVAELAHHSHQVL